MYRAKLFAMSLALLAVSSSAPAACFDCCAGSVPCGRVGCFSWKPRRQRCKHAGDLAATVSLAVAQARRLPARPVSRLGSVRVSSATPRRPPGLVAWVKVGLGCKLGSWRACLAAACTGTAWGRAFGRCHAMGFARSYANLGIVGKPLTSSTTLQAGAEAHDATAGRHEPPKQTKQGRSKSALQG